MCSQGCVTNLGSKYRMMFPCHNCLQYESPPLPWIVKVLLLLTGGNNCLDFGLHAFQALSGRLEELGIWYSYSFETIVCIVFKHYMIYFEYNVENFGQVSAVLLPTALYIHLVLAHLGHNISPLIVQLAFPCFSQKWLKIPIHYIVFWQCFLTVKCKLCTWTRKRIVCNKFNCLSSITSRICNMGEVITVLPLGLVLLFKFNSPKCVPRRVM